KVKIDPKEVSAVLITHMHFDHISGLLKDGKVVFQNADIYIAQPEHKYWTSEKEMAKAEEAMRGGFQLAVDVVKAYGSKLHLFTPNELGKIKNSLFEGITPIAAYGHTPGHTVYLIESNNEKLMVWGDIAHAMSIQMPNPDVALKYDVDYKQAIAARKKILKYVSDNKIPIAGMHIVPPGAGTIEASGDGYIFTPFK
ncbi:MAG: MBL fold metallo-hydrolase, partial [Leptospirales bacterium]|nr:MBL fold metallo-hydrolase [Leptospirales bacterium]